MHPCLQRQTEPITRESAKTIQTNRYRDVTSCVSWFRFKVWAVSTILFCCTLAAAAQTCSEPSSGAHHFRHQGESFEITINDGECAVESLELRWSNGRNNGSNFLLIFLDSDDQTILIKEINGFLNGNLEFPFAAEASFGGPSMMSVPAKVRIQSVAPFAAPAMISYRLVRKASPVVMASREKHQRVINAKGKG